MVSNEQIVYQNVKDITKLAIYEVEKGNFKELKYAAQNFLYQINLFKNQIQHTESIQKLVNDTIIKNNKFDTLCLEEQANFEYALNNFLGREQHLAYVLQNGNIRLYDNIGIKNIYRGMQIDSARGRGKTKSKNLMDETITTKNWKLQTMMQLSIAQRNQVYTIAVQRFHKTKSQIEYKQYNPQDKATFYYRNSKNKNKLWWPHGYSTTLTEISEAYVGIVVNEQPNITNQNIENSLQLFGEYLQNYHTNNIAAAIKGDVTINNSSMHFAVKRQSGGYFNSPSFRQFVAIAYNIQMFEDIPLTILEKNLTQLSNITNNSLKIYNILKDEAGVIINKELQNKYNINI